MLMNVYAKEVLKKKNQYRTYLVVRHFQINTLSNSVCYLLFLRNLILLFSYHIQQHPEVGNVFEEKPEFIDSLQKPVTAVSHSRLMFEPEDIKPSIVHVGLPTHEIIVTADNDGNQSYSGGEVILQQASIFYIKFITNSHILFSWYCVFSSYNFML